MTTVQKLIFNERNSKLENDIFVVLAQGHNNCKIITKYLS